MRSMHVEYIYDRFVNHKRYIMALKSAIQLDGISQHILVSRMKNIVGIVNIFQLTMSRESLEQNKTTWFYRGLICADIDRQLYYDSWKNEYFRKKHFSKEWECLHNWKEKCYRYNRSIFKLFLFLTLHIELQCYKYFNEILKYST